MLFNVFVLSKHLNTSIDDRNVYRINLFTFAVSRPSINGMQNELHFFLYPLKQAVLVNSRN